MPRLLVNRRVCGVVRLRPARAALAATAVLLLPATPALGADAATVRAGLAREFRTAGGLSGAYARDLTSGRDLIAIRSDAPRIPASVNKLFVTSSALLR